MILLEEAWSELFLLNAIQWCLPLDAAAAALFGTEQTDQGNNFNNLNAIYKDVIKILLNFWGAYSKYITVLYCRNGWNRSSKLAQLYLPNKKLIKIGQFA